MLRPPIQRDTESGAFSSDPLSSPFHPRSSLPPLPPCTAFHNTAPTIGGSVSTALTLANNAAPKQKPSPAHSFQDMRSCFKRYRVRHTHPLARAAANASLVT